MTEPAEIDVEEIDDQLEDRQSPLFDMFLRFERVFANRGIDKLDITDEEAERIASVMERHGGTGSAYAYLMRRIPVARMMRKLHHMTSAVWLSEGEPRGGMSYPEIRAKYDKLRKGDA